MNSAPSPENIPQVVEHFFRHESSKVLSTLTGLFGVEHLDLAEDVVQEALVKAMQTWPYYGVPKNPAAWITQVAKNLTYDVIRRKKFLRDKEAEIVAIMERTPDEIGSEQEIRDDRLRMMFVCCHSILTPEIQVALALKTLCGFGPREIANAFLTTEAAILKRLTRGKQRLREAGIKFEIPSGPELAERLDGVLQTLYLLFNEGYKASEGTTLIREELCDEAIRIGLLLAEHPSGNTPKTHALLALMFLNAARLPGRIDGEGNLLLLKDQERSRWDKGKTARGMFHLMQSATGDVGSSYHMEAGIAACHCSAPSYELTDWGRILSYYDHLMAYEGSPVMALNRAVAVANVHGPQAGMEEVMKIAEDLDSYYLCHAVLGDLEDRLGNPLAAAERFRRAIKLARLQSEDRFLSRRLGECEKRAGK